MKDIIAWLKQEEGFRLKAYLCEAGVPTIAMGNTYYRDGRPVKIGDVITPAEAESLAEVIGLDYTLYVKKCLTKPVTKNQLIALVSFCYNIGKGKPGKKEGFINCTLLKMVNANPNDKAIGEFWKTSHTKVTKPDGTKVDAPVLIGRRRRESALYFKP